MKYRVSFSVPPGTSLAIAQLLVAGQELEATGYRIKDGTLTVYSGNADIICYAPGTWRSIADVGAFAAATVKPEATPNENPRRRQEIRALPAP